MKNILKERLEAGQLAQIEHPSPDTLTAFVERSLKSGPRDNVLAHLAVCPTCRQAVTLAASESPVGAAVPQRASAFHFPVAMRWASVAAAVAVAVGVGLLHERSSNPRQVASAPPAIQAPTPAASSKPIPDKIEPKSQSKLEASGRTELNASALKNHQSGALRVFNDRFRNEIASASGVGRAGGISGGLLGGQTTSARAMSAMNQPAMNEPATGFVNSRQETQQDLSVVSGQYVTKPATSAVPPLPPEAGTPGQLQAFDDSKKSVQLQSSTENVQAAAAAPRGAAQTVEVAAEPPAQGLPANAPKVVPSVAVGGPMKGPVGYFSRSAIADWKISDTGQLRRILKDGGVADVEPAPGLTVGAVAAEGIEVWAAGVQPDASAKEWQERPVLFHSSDAGKTWARIEGPWRTQIVRLSLAVGSLTVVAKDGIWSTINAGKSWLKK